MNCNNIINSIDKTFCELTNGYEINKEYFTNYLKFIYNDSNYYNFVTNDENNNINNNINNIYKLNIYNNTLETFNYFSNYFSNDFSNYFTNYFSNYYYNGYNFLFILALIFFYDNSLIFLFGFKARWFQLHCLVNLIISINIFPEFLNIATTNLTTNNDVYLTFDNTINSYNSSLYIIALHIYHIISFKNLTFYDYFHHILFVALGVFPCFLCLQSNQYVMAYIACAGLPGIIEYGTLALYKNEKISLLKQKQINSLLYIFFRYPLCVFGVTVNFINYKSNILKDNLFMTLYLNYLLFFNGSLFTFLTLESYFRLKYNIKKNSIIYSDKTIKSE